MDFSSPIFLFFFAPWFILLYFLMRKEHRNTVLLLGSVIFYFWAAPKFTVVLLFSILVDWRLSHLIDQSETKDYKKYYLLLALVLNLGLLFVFKYFNFFIDNVNPTILQKLHLSWDKVLMPIGVSFITFHKISYILDIYYAKEKPAPKLREYALYIFIFPKIFAGPIVLYRDFCSQISQRVYKNDNIMEGIFKFSLGMAKKVLIADTLAISVNSVFTSSVSLLSSYEAWMGLLCFTFQIYFDFSGYSDMAIGLLRIFGFNIMENFNYPYIAESFTDFWKRWHITLSNWLRNYLYYPLGGNRCSKLRNYFNLAAVFIVSGIWHGANWTFVLWGFYHAFFVVMDKVFWLKASKKVPKFFRVASTFLLVAVGWVFFKSSSMENAIEFLGKMGELSSIGAVNYQLLSSNYEKFAFVFAFIMSFIPLIVPLKPIIEQWEMVTAPKLELLKMSASLLLISISLSKAVAVASTSQIFIYFKF